MNYNYELRRRKETTMRTRFVILAVILSFVPITWLAFNAEKVMRKVKIKEQRQARREALDREYGIDREKME